MQNGSISENEARIVVGLALERSYLYSEKCVQKLWTLLRTPDLAQIEGITTEFVNDSDNSVRQRGYVLQAAIQNDLSDPDPTAWKDVALDMFQQELRLTDYMYQIKKSDRATKRPLDVCGSLRDWANS